MVNYARFGCGVQSEIGHTVRKEQIMAKKAETAELQIVEVQHGRIEFCILGKTPIILNRMSEKAMHELLLPKGKKTAADKATNLKHDPYAEFVASPYTDPNEDSPTYITHLATAFKKGMSAAALDVPGSSKSQIGRSLWVDGERIPIYGIPQMLMSVTRSADMNRTPDIRTRAIIARWACRITVTYVKPILNETSVTNLLVAAGMMQGIGDWRNGKGSGTYGSYEVVSQDNPDFKHLLKTGGRKAQKAAMEHPEFYDRETEELFAWFKDEIGKRGKGDQVTGPASNGKAPKNRLKMVGV